jgi:hypothetical protein
MNVLRSMHLSSPKGLLYEGMRLRMHEYAWVGARRGVVQS